MYEELQEDVNNIKNQVIIKYKPKKIILFGSIAKGHVKKSSDIDLCIILNTPKTRELITKMYVEIESKNPFDLVLYTEKEWNDSCENSETFAYLINKEGVVLYGR